MKPTVCWHGFKSRILPLVMRLVWYGFHNSDISFNCKQIILVIYFLRFIEKHHTKYTNVNYCRLARTIDDVYKMTTLSFSQANIVITALVFPQLDKVSCLFPFNLNFRPAYCFIINYNFKRVITNIVKVLIFWPYDIGVTTISFKKIFMFIKLQNSII